MQPQHLKPWQFQQIFQFPQIHNIILPQIQLLEYTQICTCSLLQFAKYFNVLMRLTLKDTTYSAGILSINDRS